MRKIKILFYSHTIDFAGTWRSHERVLLMLNKEIFDEKMENIFHILLY